MTWRHGGTVLASRSACTSIPEPTHMPAKSGLPSLSALQMFAVAARHLNFTRAAQELCVTQGAVSRQVLQLESALGRPLFVRQPKGLALTPAGAKLAQVTQHSFAAIRQATQEIQASNSQLRVLVPTCLMRWAMPILLAFQATYAEQPLSITTTISHLADDPAQDFDVAFVYDPLERPTTPGLPLFPEHLVPVCAPHLQQQAAPIAGPADLARHVLLHARADHADWKLWLAHVGCPTVDAARGMQFETLDLSIHAAMAGYGVAMGDKVVNAPDLANGSLLCPFDASVATGYGYVMVWRSDSAVVQQLRDEFIVPAAAAARALQAPVAAAGHRKSRTALPAA